MTNDDIELQIDNFDILIYAIQIMIIMAVLIAIISLCLQILNCIIPEILADYKRN